LGAYGASAPFNPWLVYVDKDSVKEANEILKDFEKNEDNGTIDK